MAKIHNFFGASEAVDMRCQSCGLDSKVKNPRIPYVGQGGKKILVILGEIDDQANRTGNLSDSQHYRFLNTEFRKNGINIYKDCWVTSAIKCHLGNAKSTKKEVIKCNYLLMDEIKELQPEYIWTFGNMALGAVTDKKYSGILDASIHGDVIPLQEERAWLTPFFNISVIQAKKKDPNFQAVFARDLKKATLFLNKKILLPIYTYTDPKNINFLLDADDVVAQIDQLMFIGGDQAIDFETTGLKPQAEGHKIPTMAISTDNYCCAFPVDYQEYWDDDDWFKVTDKIAEYLSCKKVVHVAHNKNFENLWGKTLFKTTKDINYCTMATQHIIDHRKRTKSLKYQIFRRWGLHSYEKNAKRYISADSSNGFNKMDEMPLPEQLLYVGLDAFCTMKLHREQQQELKGGLRKANEFWQESIGTMSYIQRTGITVDVDYYANVEKELTATISGLEKSIKTNKHIKEFAKRHRRPFNDTSPEDVKDLLFKQMGIVSEKETDGGSQAVDAEVLKKLDIPVTNYILELRKYLKLRDTYLAQFKREEVDGKIHPFFSLVIPVSYRSSSDSPNFQNIPKRDKESKIIIRKGLIPSPGNLLAEIDFSGMEVSTSATYHKDPNFIKYLVTPGTDMHRDNGSDIWQLPNEEITQEIRFFIKNGWTFPQFYGDYFGSCAPSLWESSIDLKIKSGITLKEHLHELKIYSVEEFTEHCKTAEDIMWNKRFPVYTKWKKEINEFYLKNGYTETHMGFRFTGYMDKKQVANFPIQGTAFHLLLTCLNLLRKRKREFGWKSNLIGQVHDSGILDLVPQEKDEILSQFKHIAEVELAELFPWINVPFKIEGDCSEIDGNFAEMEEYKIK